MSSEAGRGDGSEGRESLEEESEGALAPNPELEEALREAAEAVGGDPKPAAVAAEAPAAPAAPAPDAADRKEAERLQKELGETRDRMLRLQADFENFRRRALKERHEALQYGHENLVKDLLGTVDNLDRAIDHARASEGGDLAVLLQGVELVRRELLTGLETHGVVEIEASGKPFDPAVHEAMGQEVDASVPPGTVIDVLQKGYRLREHLLRPARVVVARAADEGSGEGDAADGAQSG